VRHWTLTTLREKLIKIGAKVVHHAGQIRFQMAEVAVPRELFRAILDAHLADRGFCSDMNQLLRSGMVYDSQQAGDYVKTNSLGLLPER
jgi:hypothetical protein